MTSLGRHEMMDSMDEKQLAVRKELDERLTTHVGAPAVCQSIDWYHPGQSRTVEVSEVQLSVRFVGRKGRRARIAIISSAGTIFKTAGEGAE